MKAGGGFPANETTVVCTAPDGAGLQASGGFQVDLTARSVPEIPALPPGGLALLASVLAIAGAIRLRRRRRSASMRGDR